MEQELLETIMQLILYGGDAKSKSMEALRAAKAYRFEEAEQLLEEAGQSLSQAHHSQTALLTQEAQGNNVAVSLLMVHGQDHLMNAITFMDLAREVVDVYRQLEKVGGG